MAALVSSPHETGNLKYITKKNEFNALLGLIKGHKLAIGKRTGYNLLTIAKALDVDRKTLSTWLSTPIVQKAITEELEYYLEMMMQTGKNDWRQWKAQVEFALEAKKEDGALSNMNIVIVNNNEDFSVHLKE